MFTDFLFELREQGVPVGTTEWMSFIHALRRGLVTDIDGLYAIGRAILCRTEVDFDGFDQAFSASFEGVVLPDQLRDALKEWLRQAVAAQGPMVVNEFESMEELWKRFLETLKEQKERHDGGNRWVGTGGTSPFGNSGRARGGIRVGGSGGGRSAMRVAGERRWANYRSDRVLDVRDLQVVLRSLRSLVRDGAFELDIDATIDATGRNGGDIEIIERRERKNQLKVVLLMDSGGSMAPHAAKVERLFTAASRVKAFRSFETYYFHNCVYGALYKDFEELDRRSTESVLANLSPNHRLIFVGDASMAPYELFSPWGWGDNGAPTGLDWLQRFKSRCPASIWLNPDPLRWWKHPTVKAIGDLFPMFELTVDGLSHGVRKLRSPT